MRRCQAIRLLPAAVLLLATACSDPVAEVTAPIVEPEQPEARPSLPVLMVSDARSISAPAAASSTANAQVTYLALPPGSLPNVVALGIRNLAGSDPAVTVPVIGGGFDPVAVPAAAGDELELTLKHVTGTLSTAYARVPAKRPPVIVRTFPTKGRTDVALGIIPTVIFSEPVEAGTLAAGVRLFRGEEELAVAVSASSVQPWLVEVTPAAELEPATAYELRITREVRDLDGDSIETQLSVPFTTATAPAPPEYPPLPVPASRIALVRARISGSQLFVANADGSGAVAIRGWEDPPVGSGRCGGEPVSPKISPDGTRVLFAADWFSPDICLIAADGSSERSLGIQGEASWSPDGTKILYFDRNGFNTINSDGTGARLILSQDSLPGVEPRLPDHFYHATGEWLPGGTIAFAFNGGLWSMKEDGSDIRLMGGALPGYDPDWSPDGTRIAYTAYYPDDPSPWEIGSTAADGTDVRIHVRAADYLGEPEWSPDGRYIAFVRRLDEYRLGIFVVDVASGVVGRLVPDASYNDYGISWAQGVR